MQYFFILGRNPKLSCAEIYSYLECRKINFETILFEQNILLIEVQEEPSINIQNLGGTIMLGKIISSGTKKDFLKGIEDYFSPEEKFSFAVIGNLEDESEEVLMTKFRKEKLKAQVRHSNTRLKIQDSDDISISKASVHFFCHNIDKKYFFGRIEQEYSSKDVKERDMKKPVRRESLAISPRLAKILINLSQVKHGELLLDPFCGIGGIIQEALLQEINCFGCDKDRDAIIGSRKNLSWLYQNYKINAEFRLLNSDSKNLPDIRANGIATEPALGELVRRRLDDKKAKEFISEFESLIIPILKRIKQVKTYEAKIALTMPTIKNISANLERICDATGLKVHKIKDIEMPIKEFREDQYVGRDIVVLE